MNDTYKRLEDILTNTGYVLFEETEDDYAISDYIGDSYAFIEFIVNIENEFGVELSDDFLLFELLESARGLANKIDMFLLATQGNNLPEHDD